MTNDELIRARTCNNGRAVFGHIAIPQAGPRGIGLVSANGQANGVQIQSFVIGEQRHHELAVVNQGVDALFCKFCGISKTGYEWQQILSTIPELVKQ